MIIDDQSFHMCKSSRQIYVLGRSCSLIDLLSTYATFQGCIPTRCSMLACKNTCTIYLGTWVDTNQWITFNSSFDYAWALDCCMQHKELIYPMPGVTDRPRAWGTQYMYSPIQGWLQSSLNIKWWNWHMDLTLNAYQLPSPGGDIKSKFTD